MVGDEDVGPVRGTVVALARLGPNRLAAEDVPVILGRATREPRRSFEPYDAAYTVAARLHEAGVGFCISYDSASSLRNLPYEAGMASAFGLPREEALKAEQYRTLLGITRTDQREAVPARILYRTEGLVTGTGEFQLESEGEQTRFTWDEELAFPWYLSTPGVSQAMDTRSGLITTPGHARRWGTCSSSGTNESPMLPARMKTGTTPSGVTDTSRFWKNTACLWSPC